jgi:hypothetical protein
MLKRKHLIVVLVIALTATAILAQILFLLGTLKQTSQDRATVMFITHAPWEHLSELEPYFTTTKFNVMPWNYVFLDFPIWGDYFNPQSTPETINQKLAYFEQKGFSNLLYVDVTESNKEIATRWNDSILETAEWWSLMTLNPEKSWYNYLKAGMLGYVRNYGSHMAGFAIDRIDRCRNTQELEWATQLLTEVQAEAKQEIVYVMNTLQDWQQAAARRALFLGSDGVNTNNIDAAKTKYSELASHSTLNLYYLVGMPNNAEDYKKILQKHNFIFIDDYNLKILNELFP